MSRGILNIIVTTLLFTSFVEAKEVNSIYTYEESWKPLDYYISAKVNYRYNVFSEKGVECYALWGITSKYNTRVSINIEKLKGQPVRYYFYKAASIYAKGSKTALAWEKVKVDDKIFHLNNIEIKEEKAKEFIVAISKGSELLVNFKPAYNYADSWQKVPLNGTSRLLSEFKKCTNQLAL